MSTKIFFVAAVAALALPACGLNVPDLNNPPIDDLETNPTRENVNSACTGLIVGQRANIAVENGYVDQLGILGREAYNFDKADPRYVGELLGGPLQKGSPFGGNFWTLEYRNLKLGALVVTAADAATGYDDAERAGVKGFAHTIMALDLLQVINTRDTVGAVIDVGKPPEDLAPIVSKEMVFAQIATFLDDGATELASAGDQFPFKLPGGFLHFDAPGSFLTFNRAMRARVAIYMKDYPAAQTALAASFLKANAMNQDDLDLGVYHTFGTGSGDTTNGLNNKAIFAHPSLTTDVQMNGANPDQRYTRKIKSAPAGNAQMLTSSIKFTMYSPTAPVPIIRNEELILLRAEAFWGQGMLPEAIADLNVVRQVSGGLPPLAAGLTAQQVEDEILYNRRYSLLFEGGHRWIDVRRFNRVDDLPLDLPNLVRNVRFPIPQPECDARGGDAEPACTIGSEE